MVEVCPHGSSTTLEAQSVAARRLDNSGEGTEISLIRSIPSHPWTGWICCSSGSCCSARSTDSGSGRWCNSSPLAAFGWVSSSGPSFGCRSFIPVTAVRASVARDNYILPFQQRFLLFRVRTGSGFSGALFFASILDEIRVFRGSAGHAVYIRYISGRQVLGKAEFRQKTPQKLAASTGIEPISNP